MQNRLLGGRALSCAMACFALTAVSACSTSERPSTASVERVETAPAKVAQPVSTVMQFVARARPGMTATVQDPYFGGGVAVRIDDEYHSASGRTCRRFSVQRSQSGEPPSIKYACFSDGYWRAVVAD